mmetsp:Transcript_39883/g.77913  ORF Transcript_39883/g.77913 Transcript_39883/m.77913 type:complete len:121 (+) Transcript_39883:259-621(+)
MAALSSLLPCILLEMDALMISPVSDPVVCMGSFSAKELRRNTANGLRLAYLLSIYKFYDELPFETRDFYDSIRKQTLQTWFVYRCLHNRLDYRLLIAQEIASQRNEEDRKLFKKALLEIC